MTTTVLISGGNRGLGLGLVKGYAARPNHTVIATVRNPSSMPDVPTANGSKVVTVQMEATNVNDPKKAIAEIKSKYGVTKLDIVICSAAIMKDTTIADMKDIDPAVFEEHWRVNVLGFLTFFQACVPLLQPGAKFIFMSSGSSILDRVPDNNNVCYGITKAGANYLGRYAHFEHPDLIIFPMSPGWVETDMGTVTRDRFVPDKKLLSVDDSVGGMIKVIDEATRETHSGKHLRYDGSVSKW